MMYNVQTKFTNKKAINNKIKMYLIVIKQVSLF